MTKQTLAIMATAAGMGFIALGQDTPSFDVASIKPNRSGDRMVGLGNLPGGRLNAHNVTARMLMRMAFKVQDFQITGAPAWFDSEHYDIEAKPESGGAALDDPRKMTDSQRDAEMEKQRIRVQGLLADRFKLTLHRETREMPVYALVVAKGGPRLKESATVPPDADQAGPKFAPGPPPGGGPGRGGLPVRGRGMMMGRGQLTGQAAPISLLTEVLSTQIGRTVIDRTGLKGVYDFSLKFTPDETQGLAFRGPGDGPAGAGPVDAPPPPDPSGPSVFTALQEQLGLALESQKGPVEVLVIDHVEKPSEN
jgi:uncharacterized protein (TIGR03435 family)